LFIFEHAAPQPVKPCPLLAIFMPRANDPEKIARVVAFSLDEYCSEERFEDNPVTANGANRAANHDLIEDAGDLGRLAIERAAAEARYARFVNSGQRQRPDGYADKWRANPSSCSALTCLRPEGGWPFARLPVYMLAPRRPRLIAKDITIEWGEHLEYSRDVCQSGSRFFEASPGQTDPHPRAQPQALPGRTQLAKAKEICGDESEPSA
jgi:hypothetical protein